MLNVIFASRCSFVRQPHPRPLQRSTGMLVLLKGMLTVLTFAHAYTVDASVRLTLLALSELHARSMLLSHPRWNEHSCTWLNKYSQFAGMKESS